MNIYHRKRQWKILLLVLAAIIGFSSLIYTNLLVKKLSEEELKKVRTWASATRSLIDAGDEEDLTFYLDIINDNTTIPLILVDESDNILSFQNIKVSDDNADEELKRRIERMAGIHDPIEVEYTEGKFNYIFYENSYLLAQLRWYPLLQLGIISIFLLVSYVAFSASRKAEQNQVWVGMAKETAHQLGTPISSLLAWVEILKSKEMHGDTIEHLEQDIKRLELITDRFSKIGSAPDLEPQDMTAVIHRSINYMKKRVGKKVRFELPEKKESFQALCIPPLFEWVVENLVNNAVNAMAGEGVFSVFIYKGSKEKIIIDFKDTGKGIPRSKFKTVFNPGYTTRQRGWGLGLSLVKRIIHEYHRGEIFVKESEAGKGTVFRVILNT